MFWYLTAKSRQQRGWKSCFWETFTKTNVLSWILAQVTSLFHDLSFPKIWCLKLHIPVHTLTESSRFSTKPWRTESAVTLLLKKGNGGGTNPWTTLCGFSPVGTTDHSNSERGWCWSHFKQVKRKKCLWDGICRPYRSQQTGMLGKGSTYTGENEDNRVVEIHGACARNSWECKRRWNF